MEKLIRVSVIIALVYAAFVTLIVFIFLTGMAGGCLYKEETPENYGTLTKAESIRILMGVFLACLAYTLVLFRILKTLRRKPPQEISRFYKFLAFILSIPLSAYATLGFLVFIGAVLIPAVIFIGAMFTVLSSVGSASILSGNASTGGSLFGGSGGGKNDNARESHPFFPGSNYDSYGKYTGRGVQDGDRIVYYNTDGIRTGEGKRTSGNTMVDYDNNNRCIGTSVQDGDKIYRYNNEGTRIGESQIETGGNLTHRDEYGGRVGETRRE